MGKLAISLTPEKRADEAARVILCRLLEMLRANLDGVVGDNGVEFLHDFRVATRRTRSALSQIKVLPRAPVKHFAGEFKWLGTVTGPCRDLDVFLDQLQVSGQELAITAELEPLQKAVSADRAVAHQELVASLRTQRFDDLLAGWETFLTGPSGEKGPGKAATAIGVLANRRIARAFARMVRHCGAINAGSPAESLHRLRIDGKKLRYLLEFFRSLYPASRMRPLIKELKRVQNTLGGFQDTQVQQQRLTAITGELEFPAASPTAVAVANLTGFLKQQQDGHRVTFDRQTVWFTGAENQAEYEALFGPA